MRNLEKNITKKPLRMKDDTISNEKPSLESWTDQERELSKTRYGCEIIKERCNRSEAKDKSLPVDSYVVTYSCIEIICYDITRSGKRVSIFDMYWDKFGENLKKIEWTDGRVNPKLWGYQAPKAKKRK